MTKIAKLLACGALTAALAAPLAAQVPYPYPQPYPYPGQGYPGQTYPYPGQPYGGGSVVGSIIDQLLGNRYNVTDRGAVSRCADASLAQASNQYRGYSPYGGWGGGYNQYPSNYNMRVVGITNVERRSSGLRVSGLIDSGLWYGQYGNQYWNQGALNPRHGDLTFRCSVDYRGYVTNIRIRRNDTWRRPF